MKVNSFWSIIGGLALWFFSMDLALQYGSIWDSQANPTPGVTVVMNDGEEISGELRRTWSKEWMLTTKDGTRFALSSFSHMRIERPLEPRTLSSAWRSWFPIALINLLFIAYFSFGMFLRPNRRSNKDRR